MVTLQTITNPPAIAPKVQGLSANLCLAMSKLFLSGSLKRFGFRKEEITRFDSMENYVMARHIANLSQLPIAEEFFTKATFAILRKKSGRN